MAGINGLAEGFKADANVRINKFVAMVKSAINTSTAKAKYAAVPSAANAGGFLGVLIDHFVEPNYFVPQGTVSTAVTGTTPATYNLQGKGLGLQVSGKGRFICASAVNQGDELIIADAFGRVQTNNIAAGSVANVVAIAEHGTSGAEDIVGGAYPALREEDVDREVGSQESKVRIDSWSAAGNRNDARGMLRPRSLGVGRESRQA